MCAPKILKFEVDGAYILCTGERRRLELYTESRGCNGHNMNLKLWVRSDRDLTFSEELKSALDVTRWPHLPPLHFCTQSRSPGRRSVSPRAGSAAATSMSVDKRNLSARPGMRHGRTDPWPRVLVTRSGDGRTPVDRWARRSGAGPGGGPGGVRSAR